MTRRKKSERAKLTDRLDDLCRQLVRQRDKDTCQIHSKKVYGSNSHTCHVIPKGKGASWRRFDLENMFLGCFHGHRWWHENVLDAGEWFKNKWPDRYKYLDKYRGGKPAKISTPEMEELVEEYKNRLEGR